MSSCVHVQFGVNMLTVHHNSTHDMSFTAIYNSMKCATDCDINRKENFLSKLYPVQLDIKYKREELTTKINKLFDDQPRLRHIREWSSLDMRLRLVLAGVRPKTVRSSRAVSKTLKLSSSSSSSSNG